MFRVNSPHNMRRLAAEGYTTLIDATLVGTVPLVHDVIRTCWTMSESGRYVIYKPVTPEEIAEHRLKELIGVGPYMDVPEIFGGYPAWAEGTLFPITGQWRPVLRARRNTLGVVETWFPQFDEWSASGTFAIHPCKWTAETFRARVADAGVGRFRVDSWAARPLNFTIPADSDR